MGASSRAESGAPDSPGKLIARVLGAMVAPHGKNPLRVLHKARGGRQRLRREIIEAMSPRSHEIDLPSPWVRRWAALIRRGGRVLDHACGHGRHLRYLSSLGFAVVGVDRDEAALVAFRGIGGVEIHVADIEAGPWPFAPGGFDGGGGSHFFHRPPLSRLVGAFRSRGVLGYQ